MKKDQKAKMYERIEKHGKDLIWVFGLPDTTDPVDLCKRLLRIEKKVHRATECLCNTNNLHVHDTWDIINGIGKIHFTVTESTEEEQDKFFDSQMKRLLKIIGKQNAEKVFFNYDPRGYSLKIRKEFSDCFCRDWGGCGIIAPDFSIE